METTFLHKILSTPSVSGFETAAGSLYRDYLHPYVDKCSVDVMGNSYAVIERKKLQNESSLRFMIEAHIDEIGFQVIYICEKGFLYVRRNGGIDVQCIPGSQVVVHTNSGEEILGIIGKKPIHLTTPDEKGLELENLWVDTGLLPDEVKAKISVGDIVVLKSNMLYLTKNRITSKGLDDKIGVFVVSQVMKKLSLAHNLSHTVYGVATVQEEVGCRGAITCAYDINPDISISIDVDFATDVPNCSKTKFGDIALGNGVIISRNLDNDNSLSHFAENIATENNIAYQISARPRASGGTNATKIQLSRRGVKTLSIGIPCRYMHTPVELCDLRDVEAAIELITKLIITYK
ncbi:M20/M25/M40 family metallo-hydrolase [Bacteroides sp. 519]|uniref:M20/M25/M40 family metallo-hydrolase n=1 Tax=Bacteroides sp. 519 TaxID=2302937 RepID=UPI0013D10546|nr:M20/M25/M40 family metallo-hydrolase [Bacteroides sp. 519]NDV57282.1 M42 family peptidase [Bacteroides sp. 519]